MQNILYLDDLINLYSNGKLVVLKPYKNTLKLGKIIDRDKFIIFFNKHFNAKRFNGIFKNDILVIINKDYTCEDRRILINVLEELNFKNISFMPEVDLLKIVKKRIYINYNYSYFYLYYLDDFNKVKMLYYEINEVNKLLLKNILKYFKDKEIFVYGKGYQEVIKILEKMNLNYYYFINSENLIMDMGIKNSVK